MYKNTFTPGYEVLSKSGFSIDSHGSLSNTASYLITNDFPDYAAMFYSPTEHEVFSTIKYGNFEQDYSNLREIQQSLNGPPIEFYIPSSFGVQEGVGRQDDLEIMPIKAKDGLMDRVKKEAMQEIVEAQREAKGKIKKVEVEDVLFVRKRTRTIIFENEK